jgi:hypothetical protein
MAIQAPVTRTASWVMRVGSAAIGLTEFVVAFQAGGIIFLR